MPITPVSDLVARAKERIVTLPVDEVRRRHEAGSILLVDIRDVRELARTGRIPGAIHAPRGMLEFWVDPASPYHRPDFDTDRTIVLFCAAAQRSALAVLTLQEMGVADIAEMEGGFAGWQAAGGAVEQPDGSR
ncbi:rhodanese domain protein [Oceaniovalibus guishaninsula JLT2003]|uniref:Rhodanese domain protein n=1 Tax=Oceaniovalibus guishaninsula JLT2003 TaxID=1231392 RepID=K2I5P5_9RHOB|nr:rhodanese-like domain-containing protein [Oceaniovalibus guishaninsula]EKE44265.1 rhodanese domain protein [Oceaniovalibus guishaninsula JLT2003]